MPALSSVVSTYLTAVKTALQTGSDLGSNVRGAAMNYLRASDMATVLDLLQSAMTQTTNLTVVSGTTRSLTDSAATFVASTQIGNTVVFNGNVTAALAGVTAVVRANNTTTLAFEDTLSAAPAAGDTYKIRGTMFDKWISDLREGKNLADSPAGNLLGDYRSAFGGLLAGLERLGASPTERAQGSLVLSPGSTSSVVNLATAVRPDELKGKHVTLRTARRTVTANDESSMTLNTPVSTPGDLMSAFVTGTTEAPYNFAPGATLVVDVDAVGDDTATFDATAAVVTGSTSETFALTNGWTLLVSVDGGAAQTATFNTGDFANIALATAAEVATVINADIAGVLAADAAGSVEITSDTLGTGSNVTITGGLAAAALGLTAATDTGTGDVANIDAVTFAEVKTVVEADIPGLTVVDSGSGKVSIVSDSTGTSSSIAVDASSTLDTVLGLSNTLASGISTSAVTVPISAEMAPSSTNSHAGGQPGENRIMADLINQLQTAVVAFTLPT
jgi:hypothetical protein